MVRARIMHFSVNATLHFNRKNIILSHLDIKSEKISVFYGYRVSKWHNRDSGSNLSIPFQILICDLFT